MNDLKGGHLRRGAQAMLNRFRIPEAALGALVGFCLSLGVWGWIDSYGPTERQKDECYEAAKKTGQKGDECKSFWERTTYDPIAFFTLVLAISTAGLWVATALLYRAGERQFRLAREEMLSTHRPKIRIKAVFLMNQIVGHDEPIIIRVACVNTGATDAALVSYGISLMVIPRGVALPPDWKIPNVPVQCPLPNGITVALPDFCDSITAEQEIRVRHAESDLYCLGYLHYWDGLGRSRMTAFCRRFAFDATARRGRFVATNDPDYEYAD
jgi:hypothetical protein